jgi:hypothetical protein
MRITNVVQRLRLSLGSRFWLKVLDPGLGLSSDSQLFESRLARLELRLGAFEPMDNIKN